MMKNLKFFILLISALTVSLNAASNDNLWVTDFEEAKKIAKKKHQDILVLFTGSDWCSWCIKLKNEVLDKTSFRRVADEFVLVFLDFPQVRPQSDEQKAANKALSLKYQVFGFPTVLLMNSDGVAYAKTGYKPGGPNKYIDMLHELKKKNTPEGIADYNVSVIEARSARIEKAKELAATKAKKENAKE